MLSLQVNVKEEAKVCGKIAEEISKCFASDPLQQAKISVDHVSPSPKSDSSGILSPSINIHLIVDVNSTGDNSQGAKRPRSSEKRKADDLLPASQTRYYPSFIF